MASKTTKANVVDRGTSGGKSYYSSDITTLADGSVQRQTYSTDGLFGNKYQKNLLQLKSFMLINIAP